MSTWREKLRLVFTLKCDEAAHLTSESLDRSLQVHENLALRGHRLVCWSCRQFRKQLLLMKRTMREAKRREEAQLRDGPSLPVEMKQRLKELRRQ